MRLMRKYCNKSTFTNSFETFKRTFCAATGSTNESQHSKTQLRASAASADDIDFPWQFLTNEANRLLIKQNIINRKGVGDIDEVISLHKQLQQLRSGTEEHVRTKQKLQASAFDLPNMTDPRVPIGDESRARIVSIHGRKQEFNFEPRSVVELGKMNKKMLQTNKVANFCGPRTYHLKDELADLESALVQYTLEYLLKQGFDLISVPDFVPADDVESCGFKTTGIRTQVYKLSTGFCLSGTGEMSIASFLRNKTFEMNRLPLRLATVSRCYRAETSDVERERGLYRVHQFTKVEMFGVTSGKEGKESNKLLEEFLSHQIALFTGLDLHFRVLDMPSQELGPSAYRKYDIETWLPAKKFWGEISSSSDCTDYQSRRLNIKYQSNNTTSFCHTVNGTACALPRMLISLAETNQTRDGSILLAKALVPYMDGKEIINLKTKMQGNL